MKYEDDHPGIESLSAHKVMDKAENSIHDTEQMNRASNLKNAANCHISNNHNQGMGHHKQDAETTLVGESKRLTKDNRVVRTKFNFDDSSINYSSLSPKENKESKTSTFRDEALSYNETSKLKDGDVLLNHHSERRIRRRSYSWGTQLSESMNDFENAEKIILDAVDLIEDELDTHIPLPFRIKVFIEEYLFGWDHLLSDIMGSLFYPIFVFIMQYYIFKFLWMKNSLFEEALTLCVQWICGFIKIKNRYTCWNVSIAWNDFVERHYIQFGFVRVNVSIVAAIITFRLIRRRRKVWFRSSFGSKAYLADSHQRRMEVYEVDRTTVLGRIRKNVRKRKDQILANRVRKKLIKASNRFEKKASRNNLVQFEVENRKMLVESVAHDQVYLSENIQRIPYAHGGYFGAAPFMLADPLWVDILRTLMPNVYVEVAKRIFAPAPKLIHWGENNPVVAAYGTAQELEWRDSQRKSHGITLEWDVFLDPILVRNLETTIQERKKLLQRLNCEEYSPFQKVKKIRKSNAGDDKDVDIFLMQVLEIRDKEIRRKTQLVLEKMLIAHGSLYQLVLEQTGFYKSYVYARVRRMCKTLGGGIFAHQWLAVYAEALRMGMIDRKMSLASPTLETVSSCSSESDSSSSPTFHSFLSHDSDEEEEEIWENDQMENIIHFSRSIDSADSALLKPNYGSVQIETFLPVRPSEDTSSTNPNSPQHNVTSPSYPSTPKPEDVHSTSLDALATSSCPTFSMSESVEIINSILTANEKESLLPLSPSSSSQSSLGLVLDLKSRHVPKQVWALIVDLLRQYNIRVEGIATFVPEDIRGVSQFTCQSVPEVVFCHSAGDLQDFCHTGQIQDGDTIYFNAGSLIWDKDDTAYFEYITTNVGKCLRAFDANEKKRSYTLQPYAVCERKLNETDLSMESTIQAYKQKYNLEIGLYCQEFAIDDAAMDFIVNFVNRNSHVYNLGLSWGGLNGVTVANIQPGRFTNTDGLWNQRYAGKKWRLDLSPKDL